MVVLECRLTEFNLCAIKDVISNFYAAEVEKDIVDGQLFHVEADFNVA